MTLNKQTTPTHARNILSQTVFVMIGLGISMGGLWTLYMTDAPYHPETAMMEKDIVLALD